MRAVVLRRAAAGGGCAGTRAGCRPVARASRVPPVPEARQGAARGRGGRAGRVVAALAEALAGRARGRRRPVGSTPGAEAYAPESRPSRRNDRARPASTPTSSPWCRRGLRRATRWRLLTTPAGRVCAPSAALGRGDWRAGPRRATGRADVVVRALLPGRGPDVDPSTGGGATRFWVLAVTVAAARAGARSGCTGSLVPTRWQRLSTPARLGVLPDALRGLDVALRWRPPPARAAGDVAQQRDRVLVCTA